MTDSTASEPFAGVERDSEQVQPHHCRLEYRPDLRGRMRIACNPRRERDVGRRGLSPLRSAANLTPLACEPCLATGVALPVPKAVRGFDRLRYHRAWTWVDDKRGDGRRSASRRLLPVAGHFGRVDRGCGFLSVASRSSTKILRPRGDGRSGNFGHRLSKRRASVQTGYTPRG